MFKFISILLMLVICFLVGAIVGVDYQGEAVQPISQTVVEKEEHKAEVVQTADEKPKSPEVANEKTVAKEITNTSNSHLSLKTASFLEVIVKGFYDVVVQILYQISQLFF